jgi:hypothetical protein
MALTASCGLAAAVYAAEIPADRLEGRWTSESGTSLTFHADHSFTSEHFADLTAVSDCDHRSALRSGRWAFYAPTGSGGISVPDETATQGIAVSLSSGTQDCSVDVYLFGDEDDPAMCPTDDPDAGCPSDGYLSRTG